MIYDEYTTKRHAYYKEYIKKTKHRLNYYSIIIKMISHAMSKGFQDYMVKKLSDLVNTALNKCSISLGDETDQPTCKRNINKAERGSELA